MIIFFSVIIELECVIKYNLSKNESCKDFCPYTFDFRFNDTNLKLFFDTSSFLFIKEESNFTCIDITYDIIYTTIKNKLVCGTKQEYNDTRDKSLIYIEINSTNNTFSSGSMGIGMNDKYFNKEKNDYNNRFLKNLELKETEKYINFIQQSSNTAMMLFGEISEEFKSESRPTCECDKFNNSLDNYDPNSIYWCCEISSIKVGGDIILYNLLIEKLYGIFAISEEYIIAPKTSGEEVLNYYVDKIKESFGVTCDINDNDNGEKLKGLICDYFNYEMLPNLNIMLNGEMIITAMSSDLFKIVGNGNKLEFKLKVNNNDTDIDYNWYLGEPIIKNYNFLLNYTDTKNIKISIMPTSSNGIRLIIIAILGGFLFFIIFLVMLYYLSKKEKMEKEMEKYNNIINDTDDIENSNELNIGNKGKNPKEMSEIINNFTSPTNLILEKFDGVSENDKNNNINGEIKKEDKYNDESFVKNEKNYRNNDVNTDTNISPQNNELCLNDYGVEIDEDNDDDFFIKIKKK